MLKRMMILVVAFAFMEALTVTASAATANTNDDFETGDLSGWETYTTATGTIGAPIVEPYDVNGDLADSLAFKMKAGRP